MNVALTVVVVDDDAFIVLVFAPTEVVTGFIVVELVTDFALVVVTGAVVVVAATFAVDCSFGLLLLVCTIFAPPPPTVDCFALVNLTAEVVVDFAPPLAGFAVDAAVTFVLNVVVAEFALMAMSDVFALDLVAGFELSVLFAGDVLFAVVGALDLADCTVLVTAVVCWGFVAIGDVAGFALQ